MLLCSDGLINHVRDEEIAQIALEQTDPDRACEQLVTLANERGGRDNISVVIVRVERGRIKSCAIRVVRCNRGPGSAIAISSQPDADLPILSARQTAKTRASATNARRDHARAPFQRSAWLAATLTAKLASPSEAPTQPQRRRLSRRRRSALKDQSRIRRNRRKWTAHATLRRALRDRRAAGRAGRGD